MMSRSLDVVDARSRAPSQLDDLYVRHVAGARRLAFLLTGNLDAAEDLVQDAFVRLLGRFRHLHHREAFGAYLRRTVVNLHLSRLRRLRVERAYLDREGRSISSDSELPDVGMREDLWVALHRLPDRQRAALILRYYQDLSEQETAETLRCSVPAAKSLVARGLAALRAEMEGNET
jgi:RNA polymerase sigma-70 factor (sigma-E family)